MPPLPPLARLAAALDVMAGLPAIVLAVVAAGLLITVADWRLFILILQLFYIALALASLRMLPPEWAILRMMVGGFIGIMWFLSARQITHERLQARRKQASGTAPIRAPGGRAAPVWPVLATTTTFRGVVVAMIGIALFMRSAKITLPGLSPEADFLCLWLAIMGLLALALDEEPLKAGSGLLMWLAAVQIFYGNLTHDAGLIGVIGALELLVGLACAYLMVARAAPVSSAPEQEPLP